MLESDFIFGSYISSLAGERWSGGDCAEQGGTELFNSFKSFLSNQSTDCQYYFRACFCLEALLTGAQSKRCGNFAGCATNSVTVGNYTNLNCE